MFSKQFDTLLKIAINNVFVHKDFDFVHFRVVPDSILYSDAVGTFRRMRAVPKLGLPERAQIFGAVELKIRKQLLTM